jgi:hypothetical protein
MSTKACYLFSALLLLGTVGHCRADERPSTKMTEQQYLAGVRDAARQLLEAVEHLQEDIIADLGERKERVLYRKADAALVALAGIQASVKSGASREHLYKVYEQADLKLHDLLKGVDALGPEFRALHRSAARVLAVDEQLYYSVSAGDVTPLRAKQVLEREAQALLAAARELERAAQYALAGIPGDGKLPEDAHKLVQAVEVFQKSVAAGPDREQARRSFAAVTRAWEEAIEGLKLLKPGENAYVLRSADRLDQHFERLYRALGVGGQRPKLIIRT